MKRASMPARIIYSVVLCFFSMASAGLYEVGPGLLYGVIGEVPLESVTAGDTVLIHCRELPYKEKWAISATGTEADPVVFSGVPCPDGTLPVIDGQDAVTRTQLSFWNDPRSIIKIGGSSTPGDPASHIIVQNLDIRSARPGYMFSDDGGAQDEYAENAAAIHLEEGDHITIRNCILHDCGNGFFCSSGGRNVVVENCHIYDNGIEGSIYEHNNYTEAHGITFQFNRFGYLRDGCLGNNLKDRSSGCVIRYNWIEGGNRQLDLVESDYETIYGDPSYRATYVYGNVLIEPAGHGNRQIVHYGGDSGDEPRYRKGILYFYHNTVVSTRTGAAEGRTTLLRLSSDDETADVRNSILYVTETGNQLAILDESGTAVLRHNRLKPGWVGSHGGGQVNALDSGGNIEGDDPGFTDFGSQDFTLSENSACRSGGTLLPEALPAEHVPSFEYVLHQKNRLRHADAVPDIGAFEYGSTAGVIKPSSNHKTGNTVLFNTFLSGNLKEMFQGREKWEGLFHPDGTRMQARQWRSPPAGIVICIQGYN